MSSAGIISLKLHEITTDQWCGEKETFFCTQNALKYERKINSLDGMIRVIVSLVNKIFKLTILLKMQIFFLIRVSVEIFSSIYCLIC